MPTRQTDLFDDSTMSFGEHLEVLRVHLWKALIGVVICVVGCLYFGDTILAVVRKPIDDALLDYSIRQTKGDDVADAGKFSFSDFMKSLFSSDKATASERSPDEDSDANPYEIDLKSLEEDQIVVKIKKSHLRNALAQVDDEVPPEPAKPPEADEKIDDGVDTSVEDEPTVAIVLQSDVFRYLEKVIENQAEPITLTVQEAFMMFLKVSLVSGLVIASPWVFYQLWLFVAAGLYPNERKYVYIYGPMSIGLFLTGVTFCFFLVFPFVLKFLLGFNAWLHVNPQIRLSDWISFAIMLPVMFGLSFQLPIVMLFLERISIFDVEAYRTKRRMAVLVIAIVSMLMTPADPASMLLMMFPLILLYELGILLCGISPTSSTPFDEAAA